MTRQTLGWRNRNSVLLGIVTAAMAIGSARAAECDQTSVGLVPLTDLGAGTYLGRFQGGLYPGGANGAPPAHRSAGIARAHAVQPRDASGAPDADGTYVLLSIGMSNTTQEFCSQSSVEPCDPFTFMGQAAAHPAVDHGALVIANGARGGQAAETWDDPADANYDRVRDEVLAPKGVTEAQVQVVWVKEATAQPTVSLPAPGANAYELEALLGDIARAVKVRYPNVQMIFFSSRIYAGYASTTLNPEPYAYESGFSVKWLIEAQIAQMAGGDADEIAGDLDYGAGVAPWLGWGPYLWADGLVPRSDGLTWGCSDFSADGTHPALPGREKVGTMLLEFFLGSPFTRPWFRVDGDLDGDGHVTFADLLLLLSAWGPCGGCAEDLDGSGVVGFQDLLILLGSWG